MQRGRQLHCHGSGAMAGGEESGSRRVFSVACLPAVHGLKPASSLRTPDPPPSWRRAPFPGNVCLQEALRVRRGRVLIACLAALWRRPAVAMPEEKKNGSEESGSSYESSEPEVPKGKGPGKGKNSPDRLGNGGKGMEGNGKGKGARDGDGHAAPRAADKLLQPKRRPSPRVVASSSEERGPRARTRAAERKRRHGRRAPAEE